MMAKPVELSTTRRSSSSLAGPARPRPPPSSFTRGSSTPADQLTQGSAGRTAWSDPETGSSPEVPPESLDVVEPAGTLTGYRKPVAGGRSEERRVGKEDRV